MDVSCNWLALIAHYDPCPSCIDCTYIYTNRMHVPYCVRAYNSDMRCTAPSLPVKYQIVCS